MASRLILKDIKAPIHFLLRNPASSAPLAQTIQNLPAPIPVQSIMESSKIDRTPPSRDSMPRFDGGCRIEVREKRPERFEDADEMIDSGSDDVEDFDEFSDDHDEESGGDFYDDDDAEPRDDEL